MLVKNKMLFSEFGLDFVIKNNDDDVDDIDFKAFMQPLRYKNKLYLSGIRTELGYDGLHKYLLISPPENDLALVNNVTTYIMHDQTKYSINHTEKVYFGQDVLYVWSIISKI